MGRLPQAICAQIEYLLETPEVYGIGLLDKKEIMGSASFLLRKGSEIQPEIVETFVKLASIALKKWRMEEALRQSEQQKEEIVRSVDCLLQTSTDMIFSFDRQGKLINSNKALYNELGYSEQELFDSSILSLVHPDDIDEIKKQTAAVFKGKTIQNLEFRCTTKKGHQIITSMSSSPLYDMAGNIVGVLCIARNISEKKQILEKLRQEYRSLEQQMVVHARELKAPIQTSAGR
jgi:PAS domain S-box-containing protein